MNLRLNTLGICAFAFLISSYSAHAFANNWIGDGSASCNKCGVPDAGRKIHQAISDTALRNNQPVTLVSGTASKINYQLSITSIGADFKTEQECIAAIDAFARSIQIVFEEYNGRANLRLKHKCINVK
jgi:hypothetical protein